MQRRLAEAPAARQLRQQARHSRAHRGGGGGGVSGEEGRPREAEARIQDPAAEPVRLQPPAAWARADHARGARAREPSFAACRILDADTSLADTGRAESGRPVAGRSDAGYTDAGRADAGRADAVRADTG